MNPKRYRPPQPYGVALYPFSPEEGHNNALWKRARECRKAGIPVKDAYEIVASWCVANQHLFTREVPAHEIETQVYRAFNSREVRNTPRVGRPRKLTDDRLLNHKFDANTADFVLKLNAGFGVQDLTREGHDPNLTQVVDVGTTMEILKVLFTRHQEDPWVCVGDSVQTMRTSRLSETLNADFQFCVPNPMRAQWGMVQNEDRLSQRCNANACDFNTQLFTVVEWDSLGGQPVSKDDQAKLLWFLNATQYANLLMVVDSGNKSLQGWFYVGLMEWEDYLNFLALAKTLGADPAGQRVAQAFRAPNGWRTLKDAQSPVQQRVVYWKPEGGQWA